MALVLIIGCTANMIDYNVDWGRWVRLMLPISMRRPLIIALLDSALRPLASKYTSFRKHRFESLEFLQTTGQVCYLRGILQRHLPSALGILYRVETAPREAKAIFALSEASTSVLLAQASDAPIAYSESMIGQTHNRIVVSVPGDIYDRKLENVKSIVERYRVPGKQVSYVSLNNNKENNS